MSNKKFTPGPWGIGYGNESNALGIYTANCLDNGAFESPVCLISPIDKVDETDMHNARLIASAPELFEILQEMERQFGGISAVTLNQKKAIKRAKDIINNLIYPNI
jgi:hypothetical protein